MKYDGKDAKITYEVYSDAAFGSKTEKRSSVTGYALIFSGGAVCYRCNVQDCIALNTSESETIALSDTARESKWLSDILADIGFPLFSMHSKPSHLTRTTSQSLSKTNS